MFKRLSLVIPLIVAAACTKPNNMSLQVTRICYPPAADSCSFEATCAQSILGNMALDLSVTSSLFVPVEVFNHMTTSDVPAGANDAYVEEVEVSCDAPFSVRGVTKAVQQYIPAKGSAVVGANILTVDSAKDLLTGVGSSSADVTFNVKLKGKLGDRVTDFETAEFPVRVTVCNGTGCVPAPSCDTGTSLDKACPGFGQAPYTFTCK